jgi:UDPglucose--hexose-1-phosphate uridylyltransferase
MSQMRFNPITLDWVIMAPDRAHKPNDFLRETKERPLRPAYRAECPFCPGNEAETEAEICRATAPDGSWMVRVVPNKFPAFIHTDDLKKQSHGTFRSMAAAGSHEVVIEHPRHDMTFREMDVPHIAAILRIYRERYLALEQLPYVESLVIFKNHGERAGTSLEHPHSQITAAPVVSSQVFARLEAARRFHREHDACLYCRVLQEELEAGERILEERPSFVAFVPYAGLSPYHMWIFPRTHEPSFGSIIDEDIAELAEVLSRQLRRLAVAAGDPAFNFTIRSSPVGASFPHFHHWYVAIVPRISYLAGFELGSGVFINSLRPELAAQRLRGADGS